MVDMRVGQSVLAHQRHEKSDAERVELFPDVNGHAVLVHLQQLYVAKGDSKK